MKKPFVARNLVKYEGLELKNDQRRLNIETKLVFLMTRAGLATSGAPGG